MGDASLNPVMNDGGGLESSGPWISSVGLFARTQGSGGAYVDIVDWI